MYEFRGFHVNISMYMGERSLIMAMYQMHMLWMISMTYALKICTLNTYSEKLVRARAEIDYLYMEMV